MNVAAPIVAAPVMLAEWKLEPDEGQRLIYQTGTLTPAAARRMSRALRRSRKHSAPATFFMRQPIGRGVRGLRARPLRLPLGDGRRRA